MEVKFFWRKRNIGVKKVSPGIALGIRLHVYLHVYFEISANYF